MVLWLMRSLLCSYRIVCEMGEAKPSQHAGFVEICVAVCRPEFMARSSQLYYFMVSPECQRPAWVQIAANLMAISAEQGLHPPPMFMGPPQNRSTALVSQRPRFKCWPLGPSVSWVAKQQSNSWELCLDSATFRWGEFRQAD